MTSRSVRTRDGRPSLLTDDDLWLFAEGTHARLYEVLGAHPVVVDGQGGTMFALWAPEAEAVSVVGDFNGWEPGRNPLHPVRSSGIWEGFVPGVGPGALYKYHLVSRHGPHLLKADPFAFYAEVPPLGLDRLGSLLPVDGRPLAPGAGEAERPGGPHRDLRGPPRVLAPDRGRKAPLVPGPRPLLAAYAREMGFTHVELLPVMEHPFYGSWGYQTLGYFAPTSRYGPRGLHVPRRHPPSPRDRGDPRLGPVPLRPRRPRAGAVRRFPPLRARRPPAGVHPDWGSFTFNYGRHEVRSFLLSSALFWLDRYHADGLRVDAVASMLYLDYSRREEWVPNPRAAGRTSTRSPSSRGSTRPCTGSSPTSRPSLRSPPPGPGFRVPPPLGAGVWVQVGHGLDA